MSQGPSQLSIDALLTACTQATRWGRSYWAHAGPHLTATKQAGRAAKVKLRSSLRLSHFRVSRVASHRLHSADLGDRERPQDCGSPVGGSGSSVRFGSLSHGAARRRPPHLCAPGVAAARFERRWPGHPRGTSLQQQWMPTLPRVAWPGRPACGWLSRPQQGHCTVLQEPATVRSWRDCSGAAATLTTAGM